MRRCSLLLAAGAALAVLGGTAPTLSAQAPASQPGGPPAFAADTTYRLGTVEVTADKERGSAFARLWRTMGYRSELTALARENRALSRQLRQYDLHIARLEARRDSLLASRALREHRIAMLDSAAAATRAERIRVEAQVRMLEDRTARDAAVP